MSIEKNIVILILCFTLISCSSSNRINDEGVKFENPTKLTVEVSEGTNMAAVVSPNSKEVAIDLHGRIWILPIEGGSAIPITELLGDARQPSWSPDGKRICFQGYWEGNWHIYTVAPDGSNLQKLTHGRFDHREPQWSPDGKTICFTSDRSGNYDIWSITLADKNAQQLTVNLFEEFAPSYNKDGSKILYGLKEGQETFINEIILDDMSISSLYSSDWPIAGLSYSLDNSKIYYNQVDESRSALFEYDLRLDKTRPAQLTKDSEDVFPFRISWVNEHTMLYTSSGTIKQRNTLTNESTKIPFLASLQLETKQRNYSRKKREFNHIGIQKVKGIYQPTISPDGTSLSFVALGDIWLQHKNQPAQRITKDLNVQLSPSWSRDGKQLVYASDLNDDPGIWSYDLSSQENKFIGSTTGLTSGIDWNNDGNLIYALNFGPRNGTLWKMNVSTGISDQIGKSYPYSLSSPSISHNGKWIANSILSPYSKLYREGINRIIYTSIDGKQTVNAVLEQHASVGMRGNDGPKWSPTGDHIAYVSKGFLWIVRVDEDGKFLSKPTQLTRELTETLSWQSDGQHICYQSNSENKIINIQTKEKIDFNIDLSWSSETSTKTIAIKAGTIFNGIDSLLIYNQDIIINGNRITAIEPHNQDRIVDEWIDASDQFVIPGLIDIHSHQGSTDGVNLGKKWLSWGVTSTRDPATNPYDALNRKEAMQSGSLLSPRVFFTGSPLDGNRVYYGGTYALQDRNQLLLELNRSVELDYDFIKTYVRLSDPLQKEVVELAHSKGLPVYSHELYPASSYGVDGVEHILGTSRRGYNTKMSNTFRSYNDVTDLIASSRMSFTPTIGIYVGYDYMLSKDPSVLKDERLREFEPPWVLNAGYNAVKKVNSNKKIWEKKFNNAAKMIKDIQDKGGLVVAGTDGPILPFGFGLHVELECYQNAGLSPFEVIQTATINNAKVLGVEHDLGSIETGKLADLVFLNSNPLKDVRALRDIQQTMINGQMIKLSKLLGKK